MVKESETLEPGTQVLCRIDDDDWILAEVVEHRPQNGGYTVKTCDGRSGGFGYSEIQVFTDEAGEAVRKKAIAPDAADRLRAVVFLVHKYLGGLCEPSAADAGVWSSVEEIASTALAGIGRDLGWQVTKAVCDASTNPPMQVAAGKIGFQLFWVDEDGESQILVETWP